MASKQPGAESLAWAALLTPAPGVEREQGEEKQAGTPRPRGPRGRAHARGQRLQRGTRLLPGLQGRERGGVEGSGGDRCGGGRRYQVLSCNPARGVGLGQGTSELSSRPHWRAGPRSAAVWPCAGRHAHPVPGECHTARLRAVL